LVGMGPPLPHLSCTYKPNGSSNSSHVDDISGHDHMLDSSSSSDHVRHYELAQAALHSHAMSTTSAAVIVHLTSIAATPAMCQQQQHQQLRLPSLPRPRTNRVPRSHCRTTAFDPHMRRRQYAAMLRQAHHTVRSVRMLGLERAQHSPLVIRPSLDRSTDNPDATDSEHTALPQ